MTTRRDFVRSAGLGRLARRRSPRQGRGDRESNTAVVRELLEKHRLFTTRRDGLANGDCVRVTPALYNTPPDADRLVAALREIAVR